MVDEHLLIDRVRRGDMQAFSELVENSKVKVFRLAFNLTGNRHDAEDLSQDVFVKAYRSLSKFRGDAKWSTWLYRITVNTCMDHKRSNSGKGKEVRYEYDDGEPAHDAQPLRRRAQQPLVQVDHDRRAHVVRGRAPSLPAFRASRVGCAA